MLCSVCGESNNYSLKYQLVELMTYLLKKSEH
nr:MAG TPA: Scavenger receptor cysteine-rich domain [Caudoviricetes sp.]